MNKKPTQEKPNFDFIDNERKGSRKVLIIFSSLFFALIAWSLIFIIDITSIAEGEIIPLGEIKVPCSISSLDILENKSSILFDV